MANEHINIEEQVALNRPMTSINRRGASRTVPLEVICPAFSRSATDSLKRALQILGYDNVYHGAEALFENTMDCYMWEEAIRAKYDLVGKPYGRDEWDQLLGHCMATTDWPTCQFAPELIEAYPEAKVILAVRDVDDWYKSMCNTLFTRVGDDWLYFIRQFEWRMRISARASRLGFDRLFGATGREGWKKAAKRRYLEHNAMIKGLVAPERLLVWTVKDGWGPICQFLGKPVPAEDFPRGNQAAVLFARIQNYTERYMAVAYRRFALLSVIFIGLSSWAVVQWTI